MTILSEMEEMPPQIEEHHPSPPEKKQKIEEDGPELKHGGEKGLIAGKSSDQMEARKLEEGEKDEESDSEESSYEWVSDHPDHDYLKFYKNLPEKLYNIVKSPPEPNPDIDYCPVGNYNVDWELWDEYYKQIEETEGFGVKIYPTECANAYLRPHPFFKKNAEHYKWICQLADLAIKQFNMDNAGKEFKLVDVEWVVDSASRGIMYYLTFTAEDPKEGVKTFEARVLDGIGEQVVSLCRIKK